MNRIVGFVLAALVTVTGWSMTTPETQAHRGGCFHPLRATARVVLGVNRRERRRERRAARHCGCAAQAQSCGCGCGGAVQAEEAQEYTAPAPVCAGENCPKPITQYEVPNGIEDENGNVIAAPIQGRAWAGPIAPIEKPKTRLKGGEMPATEPAAPSESSS